MTTQIMYKVTVTLEMAIAAEDCLQAQEWAEARLDTIDRALHSIEASRNPASIGEVMTHFGEELTPIQYEALKECI